MPETSFRNDVLPLKNKLFRLALRITLNREDAEDIVQETLVRVWRELQKGTAFGSVDAFSATVCRNLALDLNAQKEQANLSLDEEQHDRVDTAQSPYERMVSDERVAMLNRVLNALPEKQRTAVQLRDIDGRTYREIAEIMHISESDVKVNIFRARQALKERLKARKDAR